MNGVILYLIGFAGCGKLTIARAIQARYDCILVDNHRINNVIFALLDLDGKTRLPEKVWDNVLLVRSAVLDTIRYLAKPGRNFIFTNELLEGQERDRKAFFAIAELARDRNALFLPVRLMISPDELSRRVVSLDRAEHFKETDPDAALKKAHEREVFEPHGFNYLEIEITALAPEEVAERIISNVDLLQRDHPAAKHL
jgi:hypothetical protein